MAGYARGQCGSFPPGGDEGAGKCALFAGRAGKFGGERHHSRRAHRAHHAGRRGTGLSLRHAGRGRAARRCGLCGRAGGSGGLRGCGQRQRRADMRTGDAGHGHFRGDESRRVADGGRGGRGNGRATAGAVRPAMAGEQRLHQIRLYGLGLVCSGRNLRFHP